jgi:Haemolymph juvenile hormone binding protein (JHBP)
MNLRLFTFFVTLTTLVFAELDQPLAEIPENVVEQQTGVAPNNLLIGALENVRFQMPCGWPDRGIPPLVPLHIEKLEQFVGSQGFIE